MRPSCGSITFVQRFGSALQSKVHFHVFLPDGVFFETEESAPAEFRELPPPSDKDVANLLAQVARRLTRLLECRGRLEQHPAPTDALELLKGASVQARLPLPHRKASWAPPRKRRAARLKTAFPFMPTCASTPMIAKGSNNSVSMPRGER